LHSLDKRAVTPELGEPQTTMTTRKISTVRLKSERLTVDCRMNAVVKNDK
jgi:hypothetical protein